MKKLLSLLILILGISINSQAQELYLKAKKIVVSYRTSTFYEEVDINVTLNLNEERCVIYSKKTQIIDFSPIRVYKDEDNYTVIECNATDTNYKNITFTIFKHPTSNFTILQIVYSDIAYAYSCYVL
jgi:hypothetical protein